MSIYHQTANIQKPIFLGNDNWQLNALNHITILFGKNGSGKSILMRSWRDSNVDNNHYVIPERVGKLSFEPGYFAEQMGAEGRKSRSTTNYSESYREQIITRIQAYFIARGGSRGGIIKGNPDDLEQLLVSLLPEFSITIKAENPPYLLQRLTDNTFVTDINALSSGESQLFTIALDILTIAAIWDIQDKPSRIILIDEPDAHLHPDLQIRFSDFIVRVMKKYNVQFVISTHSTTLLSALGQFGKDECSVIYLSKNVNNHTSQVFSENLKELSACLGGHILMGPLFASPFLLVEGDDDYRVWSQVPRHGNLNLAILPSNGDEIKKYQKLLEKIFGAISEPQIMGHALLDGDKELPQPNAHNPQTYIPFIRLNCHECENLFITDQVLAELEYTWPEAIEKIKADAANFGNKAEALNALEQADRQGVDLKIIINEISKILDTKNVHWTTRVGNTLGRNKPQGQLADFLGEQVVNSIWP